MLGVAASNYFYYFAIQKTSVAIAIILQYTAPVWVLLYVVARGQQKLTLQKVAAVGVAITGIALTIGIVGVQSASSLHLDPWGLAAAILASFSFAFYNLGGHRILARYDRWRVLVWTLVPRPSSGSSSTRRGRSSPPTMRPRSGSSCSSFRSSRCLAHSRSTSSDCSISNRRARLSPAASNQSSRSCWPPRCWAKWFAQFRRLGVLLVLSAIVIVQLPGRGADSREAVVIDPID